MSATVTLVSNSGSVGDKSFRSYGELLRWLADEHGWEFNRRKVNAAEVFLGIRYRDGEFRPAHVPFFKWTISAEQYTALVRLQDRYRSYLHHWAEVEPQWQDEKRVPYMDNSVELVQVNKWGGRRRVTVKAASGDACY